MTKSVHRGLAGHEEEALNLYAAMYGLRLPDVPALLPEITNPLFLRSLCQSVQGRGLKEIPREAGSLWLFTSANRRLLDTATKALVSVTTHHPQVLTDLVRRFAEVNDPYVIDRVVAAAYGHVLRRRHHIRSTADLDALKGLAQAIYDAVFGAGDPVAHLMLRHRAQMCAQIVDNLCPSRRGRARTGPRRRPAALWNAVAADRPDRRQACRGLRPDLQRVPRFGDGDRLGVRTGLRPPRAPRPRAPRPREDPRDPPAKPGPAAGQRPQAPLCRDRALAQGTCATTCRILGGRAARNCLQLHGRVERVRGVAPEGLAR